MDASDPITAAVFSAFIKCPMKAHLLASGAPVTGTFFADMETRISSMYKAGAKQHLRVGTDAVKPLNFGDIYRDPGCATVTREVDCETAIYDFALPPRRPERGRPQKSKPPSTFVPVLSLPWDKLDVSDTLAVCFGALALSQATGILPDTGGLDLRRGVSPKSCEGRGLLGPNTPDYRSDRGKSPSPEPTSARPEQALRRLRLPAEVSRTRRRT